MTDRQCARAVILLASLCAILVVLNISARADAHTPDQQDAWRAAWLESVTAAGGLTPALLDRWQRFHNRHQTPDAPPAGTQPSGQAPSAPSGAYTAASGQQWRALVAAHFPAAAVDTMTCLVGYESAGNPSARNPRSGASGLLQVMPFWADHFGVTRSALFDPDTNLRIARLVWNEQGYRAWSPWNRGLCR